jgi:hypothetical protein
MFLITILTVAISGHISLSESTMLPIPISGFIKRKEGSEEEENENSKK